MPKKLFQRWMPDPHRIRKNPALGFLGKLLEDPNLFHLNRHSISVAFFAGLFIAFLPTPGQIPLAACAAWLLRCNLPIAVALIWVSNPLTFPIIFYAEYKMGASILMLEPGNFNFSLSWNWVTEVFPHIWMPLLLGSIITSLLASCCGYLCVQWFWRWHVNQRWKARRRARQAKK